MAIMREIEEAADPRTEATRLRALAASAEVAVWRGLAGNPATPPEVLERLAADGRPSIDEPLASNPTTPLPVLWALLPRYGARIVNNPVFSLLLMMEPDLSAYPLAALSELAAAPEWAPGGHEALIDLACTQRMRFWPLPAQLAQNPHASTDTLRRLAGLSPAVFEVGSHPALPLDALEALVERYRRSFCNDGLRACALNPNATPGLLAGLARWGNEWVRQATAQHPRLPAEELLALLQDASHYVRSAARRNPSLRAVQRRRGQAQAAEYRALTSCRSYRCSVRPAPASKRS